MEREIQLVEGFQHLKEIFQNINFMNESFVLNIVRLVTVRISF
jgi:hypothetical protein